MKSIVKSMGLLSLLAGSALGSDSTDELINSEFSKWKCKSCPVIDGWYGDLSLGLGYSNQDDLSFASFRGVDEKGSHLALDGELHYRDANGMYLNVYAKDLGLDSRLIDLNAGKQGVYELRFGLNEIAKYRGIGSQTPFLGVGSDALTLPENWVPGFNSSDFTALDGALNKAPLKTHRKIVDAGLSVKFDSHWDYKIDYQNQTKKGTRPYGSGVFLNQTSVITAPVDFNTDQIDMRLSWNGKRSHIQFGAFGSWFKNSNRSLTWQNPYSGSDSTQTLRASLEPDNNFYQVSLSGAYLFNPKVRTSGQISIGRVNQNEGFLPYSINPSFGDLVLPRQSLNGRLNTSTLNAAGKISARVNNKLTFTARVKINERNNKTPVDLYSPVTTDLAPLGDRSNRPYGYDKKKYSIDMRYRAHRKIKFNAGYKFLDIDRTLQAIENSKEDTFWGEIKILPNSISQLRVKFENSDRDVSDYLQPDDGGPVDHPLLRKFNQADRDRNLTQVQFDLYPSDRFGVNFSYYSAKDEYTQSLVGLQNSNEKNFTLDVNYSLGEKININAFYGKHDIDAQILNALSETAIPWQAQTQDQIRSMGIGTSFKINLKSQLGLDYTVADSTGQIRVQTGLNEAPFPVISTDLQNTRLYFEYQASDHWGYRLNAEYELYSSTDWGIDGFGPADVSNVLTLGTQSPNYTAWIVRLQANYRF